MQESQPAKSKPFEYKIFDNFPSEKEFQTLKKSYDQLEFKEISSDLFNFLVSKELSNDNRFLNFKTKLDSIFKEKVTEKDPFYTFSAAYYRMNDFLLCHDDMVDERLYAFTFYLENHESGKLLIYENDCETVYEAINVVANRLVIFKVGATSYHEVQKCNQDGRKSVSGWINSFGIKNEPIIKLGTLSCQKNIEFFDLELDLENEDFFCLEFEDAKATELSKKLCGPFINRRVYEIETDLIYVPKFSGYDLIHTECLIFEPDCYILINDKINIQTDSSLDILDVFIFECEENIKNFIKYVNDESQIMFQIDALNGHMFVGKRGNCNICVYKTSKHVGMKHFIYKRHF